MQSLTPTLEAAQRQHGAIASVRLTVRDLNLRWRPLIDDASSGAQSAACSAYGCVVRARNLGGAIHVQRITDPTQTAQWLAWTLLATDAHPSSDIALSATQTGERLRLFYCTQSGGVYSVACWESADSGQSWLPTPDVVTGLPALGPLGSANGNLLYHDASDGYLKLACAPWGGAWSIEAWGGGGSLGARFGVAAAYESALYYVASCDQEDADTCRLRTTTFDPASATWSAAVPVVPPGMPTSGFIPRWPSVVYAEGQWHLGYTECYSDATISYANPIVMYSPDWDHWSAGTRVGLDALGAPLRAHVVAHGTAMYMALEVAVWYATHYSGGDASKVLYDEQVASYSVREEPFDGRATIHLSNANGRYDRPTTGLPLLPLAQAIVERGYVTQAGVERVARAPYYIMSVGVRRGGKEPTLQLECVDGWHLLGLWRPGSLYLQTGRSIGWLIADIVYRATGQAVATDALPSWSRVIPAIAIGPDDWTATLHEPRPEWVADQLREAERMGTNGLSVVRGLLEKAGGAGVWRPDGSLYCFTPSAQGMAGNYYEVRQAEVVDALYARHLLYPTEAWVFGSGVAGVATTWVAGSVRRYVATKVDTHIDSVYLALQEAGAIAASGQGGRTRGWIDLPCPCGAELYDFLVVRDSRAGELDGSYLRVTRIVEKYEPRLGRLQARLTVEAAT